VNKEIHVLLVEDSEDDAFFLICELKRGGYEPVYRRVDTSKAMEEELEEKDWDIVIADYVVPGFSGLSALELLKERGLDIPVIIVSGVMGEDMAVEAMRGGAQDYIVKNNLARLLPAVERELEDAKRRKTRRETEIVARLEKLVKLRTAELKRANEMLSDEIEIRRETEEALKKSENMFRTTLENISDAVFVTTDNGDFVFICPNACVIFGYNQKEIEEMKNIAKLLGENIYNREELLETGEIANIEKTVLNREGKERALLVNVKKVNIHGGTVLYTCRDITERKKTEEALRESEERYRILFEQGPDSVVIFDTERSDIIAFNEKACENLGYTREEFKNLRISDLEVIESHEEVIEHVQKIIKAGPDIFVTKHRTKDGSIRDVRVNARTVTIDGKIYLQSVWHDITDMKRTETELERYRDHLEELVEIRTVDLKKANEQLQEEITERLRLEKKLQRELALNSALADLYKPLISPSASLEEITHIILDRSSALTGSRHGYVASIDPVMGDLIAHTNSEMLKGECKVTEEYRKIVFPRGTDGRYNALEE